MFKTGDIVYPTEETNSRYTTTNQRNQCIFEVTVVEDDYIVVKITNGLSNIGSEYTLPNNVLTKDNPYIEEKSKIKSIMFSRGNRVIHESYPGTVFEFQNYEDSNECWKCWIYYLDGNFEVEIAEPILVYVEDISLETKNKYKTVSEIYTQAGFDPNMEYEIAQLEKQHSKKDTSKVFNKPQAITEYRANEIVSDLRDDTGDLVNKYLDELGVDLHPVSVKKKTRRYSDRELRRISNIID